MKRYEPICQRDKEERKHKINDMLHDIYRENGKTYDHFRVCTMLKYHAIFVNAINFFEYLDSWADEAIVYASELQSSKRVEFYALKDDEQILIGWMHEKD